MKIVVYTITLLMSYMGVADCTQIAIRHLKNTEDFHATWYVCQSGQATIGYGFTAYVLTESEQKLNSMSRSTADKIIKREVEKIWNQLRPHTYNLNLTENQKAVMISMAWNMGIRKFKKSSVLSDIKFGKPTLTILASIRKYVYRTDPHTGEKRISKGLVRRRNVEAAMWVGR